MNERYQNGFEVLEEMLSWPYTSGTGIPKNRSAVLQSILACVCAIIQLMYIPTDYIAFKSNLEIILQCLDQYM